MASLLRANRNYRLFFAAGALSNLADGMAALALPWVATLVSPDPFDIALVAFAGRLPWFLLALPAGVMIDRSDRRAVMVRADGLRLALSLAIVGLVLAPGGATLAIPVLAAIAFALGSAEVFRDNAAQTLLPALVPSGALERANGQLWSIEQVMGSFVGPPLAGLLIALAVPLPFLADAAAFAVAAACAAAIVLPPMVRDTVRAPFLREMGEGIRWLRAHRLILRLAVLLGLMNALATMMLTVLVLYAQRVLGLGPAGYGILLSCAAAGGVAGALLGPTIAHRLGAQRSVIAALLACPLPPLLLWLAPTPVLAGAALFLETFAGLLWNVVTVSFRQRMIPPALLGRVNSIYRFLGWGLMPLGALAGGAVVTWATPALGEVGALRLPYLLAALGFAGIAAYAATRLRFPSGDKGEPL